MKSWACALVSWGVVVSFGACGDNRDIDFPPSLVSATGASSITVSMLEGGVAHISARAIDPEGESLTYTASGPTHGTVTGTGPDYDYTPALRYSGTDAFSIAISDGANTLNVPVAITIKAVDEAPVAHDGTAATNENQGVSITLTATDPDGPALTYQLADQPGHGTVTLMGATAVYTPSTHYYGDDSFTFRATDSILPSNLATISIAVANVITCGDGFREGAEQCDDGNQDNTDACLNNCMAATCGDGVVEAGIEQCDDGNASNNDACLDTCANATCGDGFVELGVEQCDDANTSNTDGCLNTCVEATCGDGFIQAGVEQCDDANQSNTDACLNSCAIASCGDGFTEVGVEACDDGNQNNTDGCTTSCAAATCGDGFVQAGVEECDDGNQVDGDGCGHSCKFERCGDGLTQFSLGEQCDDGNTVAGDGCDANCQTEVFVTTTPVLLSNTVSCTTATANAARKISLDGSGTLYVVMQCGSSADVVTSHDRGHTFSAMVDLSADLPNAPVAVTQAAVAAGSSGTAHVAIMLDTGEVYLRTTRDGGATWSAANQVGTTTSTYSGLSLYAFNDDVFVGFTINGGVAVARNHTNGTGTFDTTAVTMSIAYFDLMYDVVQGQVVVAADTPDFHIRVSSDAGATFASEVNPPGQEYYSDWGIGNGSIFAVGSSGSATSLYVIPTSAPTTSTQVFGLPSVSTAQTRTVAGDIAGNAMVASQLDGGGIQLDYLPTGTTSLLTPRTLSATGSSPIVSALPGAQGAAVVYTDGGHVYATIQVYP